MKKCQKSRRPAGAIVPSLFSIRWEARLLYSLSAGMHADAAIGKIKVLSDGSHARARLHLVHR